MDVNDRVKKIAVWLLSGGKMICFELFWERNIIGHLSNQIKKQPKFLDLTGRICCWICVLCQQKCFMFRLKNKHKNLTSNIFCNCLWIAVT